MLNLERKKIMMNLKSFFFKKKKEKKKRRKHEKKRENPMAILSQFGSDFGLDELSRLFLK